MIQSGQGHPANPWLIVSQADLRRCQGRPPLATAEVPGVSYEVHHAGRSLWAIARWDSGAAVAYCLAHSLGSDSQLVHTTVDDTTCLIRMHCEAGDFEVQVDLPSERKPILHWRTSLRPQQDLAVPFWPRDILPVDEEVDPTRTEGKVLAHQRGPQGNVIFAALTKPGSGALLYLHNLGSLSQFFEHTQTSGMDRIGGTWPEIGFSLPAAPAERPLKAENPYTVADAYVIASPTVPLNDIDTARLFLDLYARLYLAMEKPEAIYRNWPRRVGETLQDLTHSPRCGVDLDGHRYMRAYAGADDRPPESMVQLSVLVPLVEYAKASGEDIPLVQLLQRNIPTFFDEEVGSIVRWLPSQYHLLKGQEEHMKPHLMDSWYFWHTLLNLARLVQLGDKQVRPLLLKSVEAGIQVARRFNYQWPVFYDMKTLDIIKPETGPGKGGEHDVGALFAHVMTKLYELTGDQEYVEEATKAARRLEGLGFGLAYQFNNVSFGAGALLRLGQMTGEELFRGLSDVCWANLIGNLWLWDAKYGHAKHYSTFMGLPPLTDAVYIALYEELEVLAAIHEYLRIAGDDVPTPLRVLLPEYCKFVTDRAWYHYPSELPGDLLHEKPQSGMLRRDLSIPLEDLYDGWEKPGKVGQEVYGAAAPFIVSTRHCHEVPQEPFRLHCNYPCADLRFKRSARGRSATLRLLGDARCRCHVRVVASGFQPLPQLKLSVREQGAWHQRDGQLADLGHVEWEVPGNAVVRIEWQKPLPNARASLNGEEHGLSGEKVNHNGRVGRSRSKRTQRKGV